MMNVKAWYEKVIIPTYETGKPEKNPMFLEKRIYQGLALIKLDYFAVSLPELQIWDDDLAKRNLQNCLNMVALGGSGLSKI